MNIPVASTTDILREQVSQMHSAIKRRIPNFELVLMSRDPIKAIELLAGDVLTVHIVESHDSRFFNGLSVGEKREEAHGLYEKHVGGPDCIRIAYNKETRRMCFTLFHEIGHYLQKNDRLLAKNIVEYRQWESFEEKACDAFAAQCLIPDDLFERCFGTGVWSLDAGKLSYLYYNSMASRRVVARRVHDLGILGERDYIGFTNNTYSEYAGTVPSSVVRFPPDAVKAGDRDVDRFGKARWERIALDRIQEDASQYREWDVLSDELLSRYEGADNPSYISISEAFDHSSVEQVHERKRNYFIVVCR